MAERLQVKPSWVYEQTRSRSGVRNSDPLPYIKMGLYLRFDCRDALAWLERQKTGEHNHASANTTLIHYIKEVPEVTAKGMAQVERLFSELDPEAVQ